MPAERLLAGEMARHARVPRPCGAPHVAVPAALQRHRPERTDGERRAARHTGEDDVEARRRGRRPAMGRRLQRAASGRPVAHRSGASQSAGLAERGGTVPPRRRREPGAMPPRRGWHARAVVGAASADDGALDDRPAHAAGLAGALVDAQDLLEAAAPPRRVDEALDADEPSWSMPAWSVSRRAACRRCASRGPTLPAARSGCRRARNSASSA